MLVEHFFAVANEAEGTHVPAPGADIRRRIVLACGNGSIRVLKNVIRRLVVVKCRGRIGLPDLQAAGIVASAFEESCAAMAAPGADPRRVRLDVEFDRGTVFREIMARVGKAVTGAALRANDGSAPPAAEELGMAKSTWYRVRRR